MNADPLDDLRKTELDDWDAKFWAGMNDLCLSCMPSHVVNELRHQEEVRRELIRKGALVGVRGWKGRTLCAKCGGPRPGQWPEPRKGDA